jgi:predicted DNA-binding transcriptional regulator YafY
MNEKKTAIERYRLIDSQLVRNSFPTKEYLAEICGVSIKAIEVDIHKMRNDTALHYNAPIDYDRNRKGYYYKNASYSINKLSLKHEDIEALQNMLVILKRYEQLTLLNPLKQVINKIEKYSGNKQITDSIEDISDLIQVEIPSDSKGLEYSIELYDAIRNFCSIQFKYHRFSTGTEKLHTVDPYLLKEYKNRWYLTGWYHEEKRIATFALERISLLKTLENKFKLEENFSRKDYFKYSFGITVINDYKPEQIVVKFNVKQGLYVKAQPIHPTQKIVKETKNEVHIAITVIPSYELTSQILSYGNDVELLKPKYLRNLIKSHLENSIKNYA